MIPSHKQHIFDSIVRKGLDPFSFEIKENHYTFSLTLKGSDLVFNFINPADNYHLYFCSFTKFSPGKYLRRKDDIHRGIHDILNLFFNYWLEDDVKIFIQEQNVGDPWKKITDGYRNLFESENEKFSEAETKIIEGGLENFMIFIKEKLELDQQKTDHMVKEIKELKEDLGKLRKGKWIKFFYGFVAKELYDVVKDERKRQMAIDFLKSSLIKLSEHLPVLNYPLP